MDKQAIVDDFVHAAIDSFVLSKTCYLANGTGNVIKYNDRIYIVTCRHIADDIFDERNFNEVLLRNKQRIKKDKLRYIDKTNSEIDIGLIEILENNLNVDYYTLDNFEFIEEFKKADLSKSNFFLLGYPESISIKKGTGKNMLHFSYMTLPKKDKPITDDYIYLDYNRMDENSNRIVDTDLISKLPHPGGMSGSFLFQVKIFEGRQEEIWSTSYIKVVGIQKSWNKKNWIKCSNIKYLKALLFNVNRV